MVGYFKGSVWRFFAASSGDVTNCLAPPLRSTTAALTGQRCHYVFDKKYTVDNVL